MKGDKILLEAENKIWMESEEEGPNVDISEAYKLKVSMIKILEYYWNENFHEHVEEILNNSNDFKFLELGGGSGWASCVISHHILSFLEEHHQTSKETEFILTDGAKAAVEKAKGMPQYFREYTEYKLARIDQFKAVDAKKLSFDDSSMDVVFMSAALHHFPSPNKALREIFRVLKPGGIYLGIGEPVVSKLVKPLYEKMSDGSDREKEHGIQENNFTFGEITDLINQAGFTEYDILVNKDPEFRKGSRIRELYYKALSPVPDKVILKYLMSAVALWAKK